jgi:GTP-binding protein YchF
MSVNIGIIGLAASGRTTIFNALIKGKVDTKGYTHEASAPHLGVAKVPEPRIEVLSSILHPRKIVPAEITYIDVDASVKSLAKEKSPGQLLTHLGNVDTLINVVRAFKDDSIPHTEGSLDIDRDIANMNLELTFSDLAIMEKRLERIETSLKGAKPNERPVLLHEQEVLAQIKSGLEKDIPVRETSIAATEAKTIANFQFLTAKPLLIVVNIGEDQLDKASSLEEQLNSRYNRPNCRVITLCGKLEMELSQLDDAAAGSFRADFGLTESGLQRVIKQSYDLLGLITFFTTASEEVRAWPIPKGTPAPKAAGKIHTDMERGFIRAEVISYDDLVKCGSLVEARKKGVLRSEGKSYVVQDGDVITFLFNV